MDAVKYAVLRVGTHVQMRWVEKLSHGMEETLDIKIDAPTQEQAEAVEKLFNRMILCTEACEGQEDHVLRATINLTKGLQNER